MHRIRHSPPFRWISTLISILAMTAVACLSPAAATPVPDSQPPTVAPAQQDHVETPSNLPPQGVGAENQGTYLIDLYNLVNSAVVHIRIFGVGDFSLGSGSGFLVDNQGHILTNNHVVSGAEEIEIVFWDASRVRATLIGFDLDADIAVLEVDSVPAGVSPLVLGDSDAVQVGQRVIAIGNPFGLQGTMTEGIISGLGRRLESQRADEEGTGSFSNPDIIQTDAAINPGNSGGPLLSLDGQVIGINTAIRSLSGTNSGIGFAAPVNTIEILLPHLIQDGYYTYPWMGVGSPQQDIDLNMMEALELPQTTGVYVTNVTPGSPAEEAGIQAADSNGRGGDMLVAIDGNALIDFGDLVSYLVSSTTPGQVIELTVIRDGKTIQLPLTLGERP